MADFDYCLTVERGGTSPRAMRCNGRRFVASGEPWPEARSGRQTERSCPPKSAGSPQGPDPHPGCSLARLNLNLYLNLLPTVVLLLGALTLFAAAPVAAQTPDGVTNLRAVSYVGALSVRFTLPSGLDPEGGETTTHMRWREQGTDTWSTRRWGTVPKNQQFHTINDLTPGTTYEVEVRLFWRATDSYSNWASTTGTPSFNTVSFLDSSTSVLEGSSVKVEVGLRQEMSSDLTIPVTLTAVTAEDEDFGSLSSITIPAGKRTGTGTITTAHDTDSEDETFTVALGTLPASVRVREDGASTMTITIRDDEGGDKTPNGVRSLTVVPRVGELLVSFTLPSDAVFGTTETHMRWREQGTDTWSTRKWNTVTGTGSPGFPIRDLTPGTTYEVGVRLFWFDSDTYSNWASATGTPKSFMTVSFFRSHTSVQEGSSVTVELSLSQVTRSALEFPVTLTAVTAEEGDYGSLSSITVRAGHRFGKGTITTAHDTDTDDEKFTVALGTLPDSVRVRASGASTMTITIRDDEGHGEGTPKVSLSVSPNPVDEGSRVTVTATLSDTLSSRVVIPVKVTRITAELEDITTTAVGLVIKAGSTTGSSTISTHDDADTEDETFSLALDGDELPSSVKAGDPSTVTVTIKDDDVDVSLSAAPNPVAEGSPVTVTVTFVSAALSSSVTIPLTLTDGSAEPEDHGTLASITIPVDGLSSTGTITTNQDDDQDDETFTVALGTLPSSVKAGSSNSVQITITDDGKSLGQRATPSVSLSTAPNPVTEGSPGNGDCDAVGSAFERGDDSADAIERDGGVGGLRLAVEHHDQLRFDDRHRHGDDAPGRRRNGRDVHGGAGQPAVVGDGGQPKLGGG